MNVQRAATWPKPTQDTITVASNNAFSDGIPSDVVVNPGHAASQR